MFWRSNLEKWRSKCYISCRKEKAMMDYQPNFTVSAAAISMVAEISALIERYTITQEAADSLKLRRASKIKTIQSTLAIEGNTLSLKQVTDIIDGKRVVAPLREIQEVKNAIAAYDLFSELDPFSVPDLLKAHNAMMTALLEEPGKFRKGGVGVSDGKQVVHIAPPAALVPGQIKDLFHWLKSAPDHLLIKSCVFHYEFEFIHPFADGNGRLGRLWQSLILTQLNPVFQNLPVETMVHDNQPEYYQAINAGSAKNDCGIFIDFMLNEILNALKQHISGTSIETGNPVLDFIINHPGCRTNQIAESLGIPLRTLQRELSRLKASGKIAFRGAPKNGGYFAI